MPTETPLEIRFVGDIKRLEVRPGDKYVIQSDERLSMDVAKRIREQVSEFFSGATVLVLSDGLKLGVISKHPDQAED